MHPGKAVCSHPDCFQKLTIHLASRNRSLRRLVTAIHELDEWEDYLALAQLKYFESNVVALGPQFMWNVAVSYLRKLARVAAYEECTESVNTLLGPLAGGRSSPSAYLQVYAMEVLMLARDLNGAFALYCVGRLAPSDMAKLWGLRRWRHQLRQHHDTMQGLCGVRLRTSKEGTAAEGNPREDPQGAASS